MIKTKTLKSIKLIGTHIIFIVGAYRSQTLNDSSATNFEKISVQWNSIILSKSFWGNSSCLLDYLQTTQSSWCLLIHHISLYSEILSVRNICVYSFSIRRPFFPIAPELIIRLDSFVESNLVQISQLEVSIYQVMTVPLGNRKPLIASNRGYHPITTRYTCGLYFFQVKGAPRMKKDKALF